MCPLGKNKAFLFQLNRTLNILFKQNLDLDKKAFIFCPKSISKVTFQKKLQTFIIFYRFYKKECITINTILEYISDAKSF